MYFVNITFKLELQYAYYTFRLVSFAFLAVVLAITALFPVRGALLLLFPVSAIAFSEVPAADLHFVFHRVV